MSVVSVSLIVSALKKMGAVEGERGLKKPLSVVSVVSVGFLVHRPERKTKKTQKFGFSHFPQSRKCQLKALKALKTSLKTGFKGTTNMLRTPSSPIKPQ